jgi:hypothetical protein
MKYDIKLEIGGVSVEALFNWLGGPEGAKRCLRGELQLTEKERRWTDNGDGTISFVLPPTDGTTGPQWIKRLEGKGYTLSRWAKDVLNSEDFTPTEEGVTYQVTVLRGELWSSNSNRTSKNVCAEAKRRNIPDLPAEAACLTREIFSNEDLREMGLSWLVVMHKPIKDSDGDPSVLSVGSYDSEPWLDADSGHPSVRWFAVGGFAFGSRK